MTGTPVAVRPDAASVRKGVPRSRDTTQALNGAQIRSERLPMTRNAFPRGCKVRCQREAPKPENHSPAVWFLPSELVRVPT